MILWTDHDFGGRGSFSLRDIPWQKYRQLHTPPAPERMKDSGQKGSEQHITKCPIGVSHLLSSTWTILLMTMQALFTSNTSSQWVPLDHLIQSSITSPLQCFLATSLVYFPPTQHLSETQGFSLAVCLQSVPFTLGWNSYDLMKTPACTVHWFLFEELLMSSRCSSNECMRIKRVSEVEYLHQGL